MKICFYTHVMPDPYQGGVERVAYNLCNWFKSNDIIVYHL